MQEEPKHAKNEDSEFWILGGRKLKITDCLLSLFTFLLFVATIGLWIDSSKQVHIMQDSLIADKRAFVFGNGFSQFWEQDPATGQFDWRFRPNWFNSGDTPTQNMTMHVEAVLGNMPMPKHIKYDDSNDESGKGLIAPKTSGMGGLAPQEPGPAITPQDIMDIQSGRKYLYLRGWAKYNDVFPGTPQHITRFFWIVAPEGDSTRFTPDGSVEMNFPYYLYDEGNCSDDECRQ